MNDVKKRFMEGLDTIKTLTGVSQADFDLLKEAAPEANQWVDEVAKFFYDTLFAHPRTAAVFHDGERPAREKTLTAWYLALFSTANDDEAYWLEQGRIAFAHIRRHTNNEYMIGISSKLSEVFVKKTIAAFGAERGLEVSEAFNRILRTVVGLTAEGYDVMSQIAISEATGAGLELIDKLIQDSVDDVQKQLTE
ncbi:MAG: protoglobin domain-containing protein [Chloroflexota bacterium]